MNKVRNSAELVECIENRQSMAEDREENSNNISFFESLVCKESRKLFNVSEESGHRGEGKLISNRRYKGRVFAKIL